MRNGLKKERRLVVASISFAERFGNMTIEEAIKLNEKYKENEQTN